MANTIWTKVTVYMAKRGKWDLRIVQNDDELWHYKAWHEDRFDSVTSDKGYSSPTHAQEACLKAVRKFRVKSTPAPAEPLHVEGE